MDACNIDEIQNLFIYYSACFSKYFPELGFYCNEREFQIHGIVRRYSDITGVSHDGSYFLIEMRKEYLIYLPLLVGSKFRILTKQKQLYSYYNLMLMPELISIEEAARITGFPYEEIEDWVKSRKITSFHTRTGTRMVDPENLRDFIAHIEHLGIQKLYLQLVIQDKEEEADEIIAQYDDYLFCLRSLKNISPLLKQIIAELSTFIDDKQDRYIFTEITSGAKILDVAKRISLPVTSLTLSPYIRKCLQKLELETMEDLLRYARKKGLDSLLKIPGFGPLGLDQLKFQLEKHKIMNKAGDSDLYQYIINEPDS